MNTIYIWARRLVLLLTIGGSFFLLCQMIAIAHRLRGSDLTTKLLVCAYAAYSLWGLVVGLALAEGRAWTKQLFAFLAFQVPYIKGPGFSYLATLGMGVFVGYMDHTYTLTGSVGPDVKVTWGGHDSWELAINLVPLVLIVLLMRSNNRWRGP